MRQLQATRFWAYSPQNVRRVRSAPRAGVISANLETNPQARVAMKTSQRVSQSARILAFAALAVLAKTGHSQIPNADWMYANTSFCQTTHSCGTNNSPPTPAPPRVDPCYIKQNAMRPCTPQSNAKSSGVDPQIVGSWELQVPNGKWLLNVRRDGSYDFHSEANDGIPSSIGSFAAGSGHWSLTTSAGYTDGGTYYLKDATTWMASNRLGWAAWHRVATKSAASRR
jgi:hypothetical protein